MQKTLLFDIKWLFYVKIFGVSGYMQDSKMTNIYTTFLHFL